MSVHHLAARSRSNRARRPRLESNRSVWRQFGIECRHDADGLHLSGKLEKSGTTYRLISNNGKSISFRQVSSTLLHLLDDQNRLMPGTSGWSYTLSRADVTDDPGRPELVFGGSYTLSPRESGNTLFGIFGGRTPCTRLVRALHITLNDGANV
jgi:hypothetical protein